VGKLIFSAIESLDGYVADASGSFDWAMPDEEVHRAANELERSVGTYLYGRRMYEVMVAWETMGGDGELSEFIDEYATTWRAADKVVYSTTLAVASSERTRIERSFDPEAIRRMKSESARDISVGGPGLAAQAIAAGLVDEFMFFVTPVVVGGGIRSLPEGVRLDLELLEERRYGNGMVYLRYRSAGTSTPYREERSSHD